LAKNTDYEGSLYVVVANVPSVPLAMIQMSSLTSCLAAPLKVFSTEERKFGMYRKCKVMYSMDSANPRRKDESK
jgi:hypothetical protein